MKGRVLLLDDDAHLRGLLARLLPAAGWYVETCAEATDACDRARSGEFDVALVDERRHGGTIEALRSLHAVDPRLPIVLAGAVLSASTLIEAVRVPIADVLMKPFSPAEVLAALTRVTLRSTPEHMIGLEVASAIDGVLRAIHLGDLEGARLHLRRAQVDPFDGELMSMAAVIAELEGRDHDADRGYRASLALQQSDNSAAPSPHEGLARLAMYAEARARPIELTQSSALESAHEVTLLGLGLPRITGVDVSMHARRGQARSFLVLSGSVDDAAALRARSILGHDAPLKMAP